MGINAFIIEYNLSFSGYAYVKKDAAKNKIELPPMNLKNEAIKINT